MTMGNVGSDEDDVARQVRDGIVALRRRWRAMSPQQQRLVVGATTVDAVLRAAALRSLVRRCPDRVRGPKWLWAVALPVVSSGGALPVAYFVFGRRDS